MDSRSARTFLRALLRSLSLIVPVPDVFDLLRDLRESRTTIDMKISAAARSLREASDLVIELEGELQTRAEKLSHLRKEVERYSKLAEVEESKVAALLRQLELTMSRGKGRERWISLVLNLAAGLIIFILGVLLGPKLAILLS